MFPILFEIPDAWTLSTGVLALEIIVGIAAALGWAALHFRGRRDWLASTLNMVAFLVGLHLLLSFFIEGEKPVTIYSFGVMIILGFFAGAYYMLRQTRPLGLEDKKIFDWAFWMLVVGIIGSRVFYAYINYDEFANEPFQLFKIWEGGLVWYGGLIPASIVGVLLLQKHKLPVLHVCDIGAAAIMLALGIGRWACLMAGDDYGRPTDSAIGIAFSNPNALVPRELKNVALWPTQLMMSVNCLWIFWVVDVIRRRAKTAGKAFGWMLILYAVTRAAWIEPFRGDFVERNPGYKQRLTVDLTFTKGEDTPAVTLARGAEVRGPSRTGMLLSKVELPAGKATGVAIAISSSAVQDVETQLGGGQAPGWSVESVAGQPENVRVHVGGTSWYGSHLPVPPDYVSTSQWISIFVVLAGIGILLVSKKLEVPGYEEAAAAAPASGS